MLAACSSSGNSVPASALPQSQDDTLSTAHYAVSIHAVALKPAVRNICPLSKFSFCVTISPHTTGPYWNWCGGPSCSGSQYVLVATGSISMTYRAKFMPGLLLSGCALTVAPPDEN